MSIAILTTKSFSAGILLPLFRARHPGLVLDFPLILLQGFYHLPLPRGLPWSSYPHIVPMDNLAAYRPMAHSSHWGEPTLLRARPGEALVRVTGQDAYEAALTQATHWYAAADPAPMESWASELLWQRFGRPDQTFHALELINFSEKGLQRSLSRADAQPEVARARFLAQAHGGQVKAYFDHQFLVNSLAILGRTAGQLGQPVPWVSKYQLQALYTLARSSDPLSMETMVSRMADWKGTGKYPADDAIRLGSPTSYRTILEQLQAHGWLTSVRSTSEEKRLFQVSAKGHAMLSRLHPDCEDPDLPFRLDAWMAAGLSASQGAIDRYLRTFFGKQKRFLDQRQRVGKSLRQNG